MNKIITEDINNICNSDLDWEKFKNSTVLVTGATGMIGSYMVYTLLNLNKLYKLNIRIYAIGRNYDKLINKFDSVYTFQLQRKIINIEKITSFNFMENNIDYIIHTASPADSNLYYSNPIGVIRPNVIGTMNLLELARVKHTKGFLFLSSGEVCGKTKTYNPIIEEDDYGYLDPTDVRSCYGESKRMAENLCKCYSHQYGLHTISVRPEHTFGPSMDLETDKRVFAEFVLNIINDEDILIKSDGKSTRVFCYITDAVDGFFRALLKGKSGESYNVSNNHNKISIKELAKTLIDLYPEKKLKTLYQKRDNSDKYLENKNRFQPILSIKKIEKLGYNPKIKIEEGFKRTINSFI